MRTLYTSKTRWLRKPMSWSNFIVSSVVSFLLSSAMLNANIASMPLARQLSYIRKTMSMGNLYGMVWYEVTYGCEAWAQDTYR